MPEDQLPLSAAFVDHGRTVPRFLRAQRSPEFLARILVERHDRRAVPSRETNQASTVEYGIPRETPHRRFGIEILFEIARPNNFPIGSIETKQVAFRAKREDFAVTHQRSRTRTCGVANSVWTIILVFPYGLSAVLIETKHSFAAADDSTLERFRGISCPLSQLPVGHIDATLGDCRPGVATANVRSPPNCRPIRLEFLQHISL